MGGLFTAFVLFGAFLGLSSGCGMDQGSSGEIPRVDVFLTKDWSLESVDPVVFPVTIPYGVSLLDVNLEVLSGEADLIVGTGVTVLKKTPEGIVILEVVPDFFSPAHGTGVQKILLGPESHEPLQARTWYVELVSPFGVGAECKLSVQRRLVQPGSILLEEEGQLSAGQNALFPLVVPEDAASLEVVLKSERGLEGGPADADLFLGSGLAEEEYSSLNPGTGFEVLVLGPEVVAALAGQTLTAKIEGYEEETAYHLTASYLAANPVVAGTTGSP